MSKQLRLDVAQLTDVGRKRPHNEDNMAYVIPKDSQAMARKGALFIVADGMGGHAAGEVASEIAVDTVSKVYYQDDGEDVTVSLLHAIKRANALIHQRAAENMLRSGMGTTCVSAVLRGGTAYIANVGDSRAYLVRRNQVKQVSQDHSWVAEQVRAGLLTEDQARSHAQRNVITRCLGTQADVEIDIFSEQLEDGDSLVLCTDGLSGLVGDEELRAIVDQYVPQESVYHLIERANENGGPDNITAIVIRVQEAGWEPPTVRRPVRVGGRNDEEDTAILGRVPSSPLGSSMRSNTGGLLSSPQYRVPSGALDMPDGNIQPQPAMPRAKPRRNRLFYPTLALFVLLIVALVGGGAYYFLRIRPNAVDVDASLQSASALVSQANSEVTNTPASALQTLAKARTELLNAQGGDLSDAQRTKFTQLQASFTTSVKNAITTYNQQSGITALPCGNTSVTPMGADPNIHAQAKSIAAIGGGKDGKTFSYAVTDDQSLYLLTEQHSLSKKIDLAGNPHVEMVSSDGGRLLALTSLPAEGNNPVRYGLSLLKPEQDGNLKQANSASIDTALTKDGHTPQFITAWGNDVYVILISAAAPLVPVILDYSVSGDQLGKSPRNSSISISKNIVSIAALESGAKPYLFLLYNDGSIQSLLLGDSGNNQPPSTVLVERPVPAPLSTSAKDFTLSSKIAVPVPAVLGQSSTFLSIPGANHISVGLVKGDKDPHLYIADSVNPRILDMKVAQTPDGASATPTVSATATSDAGGGVASPEGQANQVTMQLLQQYSSSDLLTGVKSMVLDPTGDQLYLLTKNGQNNATLNILSINVQQSNVCEP